MMARSSGLLLQVKTLSSVAQKALGMIIETEKSPPQNGGSSLDVTYTTK